MIDSIEISVFVKTYYKISKYKHLEAKVGKIWNLKTKAILVVIDTVGKVAKVDDCYLAQKPNNLRNGRNFEKIALIGTADIIQSIVVFEIHQIFEPVKNVEILLCLHSGKHFLLPS